MHKSIKQLDLINFLEQNPLGVKVELGDVSKVNGSNFIFIDYLSESAIGHDDEGIYTTSVVIIVSVNEFKNRKVLVDYIKQLGVFDISYTPSAEGTYFTATMRADMFIDG